MNRQKTNTFCGLDCDKSVWMFLFQGKNNQGNYHTGHTEAVVNAPATFR